MEAISIDRWENGSRSEAVEVKSCEFQNILEKIIERS